MIMNNALFHGTDSNYQAAKSEPQPRKKSVSLNGLVFWLPFIAGGSVFAAMPAIDILEHPSAQTVPNLIAAIYFGYATMGSALGLTGLTALSMTRSFLNIFCDKANN